MKVKWPSIITELSLPSTLLTITFCRRGFGLSYITVIRAFIMTVVPWQPNSSHLLSTSTPKCYSPGSPLSKGHCGTGSLSLSTASTGHAGQPGSVLWRGRLIWMHWHCRQTVFAICPLVCSFACLLLPSGGGIGDTKRDVAVSPPCFQTRLQWLVICNDYIIYLAAASPLCLAFVQDGDVTISPPPVTSEERLVTSLSWTHPLPFVNGCSAPSSRPLHSLYSCWDLEDIYCPSNSSFYAFM